MTTIVLHDTVEDTRKWGTDVGFRGECRMAKKVIALLLSIMLMIVSAACKGGDSGNKDPEQKKNTLSKFGYRKYWYDSVDNTKLLEEEYEYLGTEATRKTFDRDSGEVIGIKRFYYDKTGTKLLKEVYWSEDGPTSAYEYDSLGRLVRCMQKIEDDQVDNARWGKLRFPDEYFNYEYRLCYFGVPGSILYDIDLTVREICTEYSYDGDSEKIMRMQTTTDRGDVIASFERGQGDIILSEQLLGASSTYTFAYDEVRCVATWTYDEDGFSEADETGACFYDTQNRCVRYFKQRMNSTYGVELIYDENGGYRRICTTLENERETDYREVTYDKQDNEILDLWYDYTDGGQRYLYSTWESEYHSNGVRARLIISNYNPGENHAYYVEITEYDTNGEYLSDRTFRVGVLTDETFYEYITVPGIDGTVRHSVWDNLGVSYSDYDYDKVETYAVKAAPDPPERADRYSYSWEEYSRITTSRGVSKERIEGEFDQNGRLRRIVNNTYVNQNDYVDYESNPYLSGSRSVMEYDEKGRITRMADIYFGYDNYPDGMEYGYLWEYWDGEKP